MSDAIVKDLMRLKDAIAAAKDEQAQLTGQLKEKFEQLKEFGVSTLDEAQAKVAEMDKELTALDTEIQEQYKALKEVFQW